MHLIIGNKKKENEKREKEKKRKKTKEKKEKRKKKKAAGKKMNFVVFPILENEKEKEERKRDQEKEKRERKKKKEKESIGKENKICCVSDFRKWKREKKREKETKRKKKEKERKRKRKKAAGKKTKSVVFPILERNSPRAMGLTALCVGSAYFATSETVRKYVQGPATVFQQKIQTDNVILSYKKKTLTWQAWA